MKTSQNRILSVCFGSCLTIASLLCATASASQNDVQSSKQVDTPIDFVTQLEHRVNAAFELTQSRVEHLDLPQTIDRTFTTNVLIAGQMREIVLHPHSVLSDTHQLYVTDENGGLVPAESAPTRTFRGFIVGLADTEVAASLLDEGLQAIVVLPDSSTHWIEPLALRDGFDDQAPNAHVVYAGADIIGSENFCATTNEGFDPDAFRGSSAARSGAPCGSGLCFAEVAIDADFDFYQNNGNNTANVQTQIQSVMNAVNAIYEPQCSISHVISATIIRTTEPDPYSDPAQIDGGFLLDQMTNHWNAQQGGVIRDMAQLFSGKTFQAPTLGVAWIQQVCTNLSYSVIQASVGNFGNRVAIHAHEFGHNWAAPHCNCPNNIMNGSGSLFGFFPDTFTAGTVNIISSYRDNREFCLSDSAGLIPPFFDDFTSAAIDNSNWSLVDGAISSTNAINEPSPARSLNIQGNESITSNFIDMAGLMSGELSYQWQQQGNGNDPEPGEDLVFEFLDADQNWVEITRELGSDSTSNSVFTAELFALPAAALHANFRLRIRNLSNNNNADDWFVDDIGITAIPFAENDECGNATTVLTGVSAQDNFNSTDSEFSEQNVCFDDPFQNDVWFLYFPDCGEGADVSVSLCGTSIDTQIAIYESLCPGEIGEAVGCNDDDFLCDNGGSRVEFTADQTAYFIRVGGKGGVEGDFTLDISCGALLDCTADVGKMYFTDSAADTISRADMDGSNVETLIDAGLSNPLGIALDPANDRMYWSDAGTGEINRANLDGSGVVNLLNGLSSPRGPALDLSAGKMYWSDVTDATISRANLDGSSVELLLDSSDGLSSPRGVAVSGGKIYWADNGTDTIHRANLDGSADETLVSGQSAPDYVEIDAASGRMFWSDASGANVQSADLDGSNVEDVIALNLSSPRGLAISDITGQLYFVDSDLTQIERSDLTGYNRQVRLDMGLTSPRAIALDLTVTSPLDCDGNGLLDECEIAVDPGLDMNNDDVLDSCDVDPEPCPADIASDGASTPDGSVDTFDLLLLLEQWGTAGPEADIAGDGSVGPDGTVDTFDLLLLLEGWGDCP